MMISGCIAAEDMSKERDLQRKLEINKEMVLSRLSELGKVIM